MRWVACAALLLAGVALTSCRFIATADVPALANAGAGHGPAPFDPDQSVASIWAPKVIPYFKKKAGPFLQVRERAAKSPDEAGAKFGYRAKSEGTPWTLMVKIDGIVVAANTESRAATIGVEWSTA